MQLQSPQKYLLTCFQLLFVVLLAVTTCFLNISRTSVRDIDEGFHISATQEMQQTGNYFRPSIAGTPYYNKPPLKLWLSLLPFKYVKDLNLSFRLLDGLAGIAIAVLVYFGGTIFLGSAWSGVWAVILLFGARDFVTHHVLRSGTQDSFLVLFSTLAMLVGWRFFRELDSAPSQITTSQNPAARPVTNAATVTNLGWLLGLVVGAGALVKTVAAFVVPTALVAYGLLGAERRKRLWQHRETAISAVIIALVLPALYIIPHCILDPNAYQVFFTHELVDRALRGYHNHADYFYYVRRFVVAHSAVPLIPVLVGLVLIGWQLLSKRATATGLPAGVSKQSLLFVLLWAAVPFLVLSLVHSRLPWYTAPTMPAFALIGSYAIVQVWNQTVEWFRSNTVPDLLRRLIPPQSYVRTTVWGLCLSVLLLMMVFQSSAALYRVLNFLATKPERSAFDLLATDFKKAHNRLAVALNAPNVTILERPYLNAMRPTKVKEPELLAENQQKLIFTDAESAFRLLGKLPVTGYRFYPPENTPPQFNRPQWLAVLDTGTPPLKSVTPTKRNLVCDPRFIALPYGFGDRAVPRGSYIVERLAGIGIPGDSVLRRHPARLTLRLGLAPGVQNQITVNASLNGIKLASNTFSRADISAWDINIPAQVFQNGQNTLALELSPSERDLEKRNLLSCHSVALESQLTLAFTGDGNS